MTIALICGGRYFGRVPLMTPLEQMPTMRARAAKQVFMMREALDHIRRDRDVRSIIAGGAPGADSHAEQWAKDRTLPVKVFKAQWKMYGRSAGPIRNGVMLAKGKPDFVVAFPGGDGTADMVRQAIAAGVEIMDFRMMP
jgi:hypothetical protein